MLGCFETVSDIYGGRGQVQVPYFYLFFHFLCMELQIRNYPSDYIRHYIKSKLLQLTLSYLTYVGGLQTRYHVEELQ